MPIRGNIAVLYVMALFYLFALLSLGLLISTRAQTQMEAQQMAQLLFLPVDLPLGLHLPVRGAAVAAARDRLAASRRRT